MLFFISFLIGVVLFYTFLYFPFTSAAIALSSSVYLAAGKRFVLLLAFIFGAAYTFVRYDPPVEIPHTKEIVPVNGIITSFPERTAGGLLKQSFLVKTVDDIQSLSVPPEKGAELSEESLHRLEGEEIVLLSEDEYEIGREYGFGASLLKSRKRLNPGEDIPDSIYARVKEVRHTGDKRRSIDVLIQESRYRIQKYYDEHFPGDSASFLASVTVGQGTPLDAGLRDAFNATGLAHILSISGTHFGLLSVLLFGLVRLMVKALPYRILQRLTIYLTPSQAAALFCLPLMVIYLGLSGASIPAVRSFLMIGLFLLGLLIGRKGFWLNSLLFSAFLIVIWNPGAILSLSFQLSFLAVLFIGLSIRKEDEEEEKGGKLVRSVRNALLMTLAAAAGTAPLVAYHFHYLSVISPVSNLLIAPLIGFILIPMSVVASLFYLLTGHFAFSYPISIITGAGIYLVELFARIPFADIKIPAFPAVVVLLFYAGLAPYLSRRKKRLLLIPLVPAICIFSFLLQKNELTVTYLDVGQGDASVLDLPDGRSMVVDTGTTGREAVSFLRYRGKRRIDILAISHAHPDHTGGLGCLSEQFRVKEIWDNGRLLLPDSLRHIPRRSLSRGDVIEGQGYRIYALHPYPGFYTSTGREYDAANNDSLVFRIESDKGSFLYAGDIETEAEADILYLGKWLKSGVLKVPHHGGRTSAHELFLRTVSPDVAVISAGRDNSFGHPHQETLDALKGVRIYRTDLDGAIKIRLNPGGVSIKTYKDFVLKRAGSLSEEMDNYRKLCITW
jgi:competence protein ComEC